MRYETIVLHPRANRGKRFRKSFRRKAGRFSKQFATFFQAPDLRATGPTPPPGATGAERRHRDNAVLPFGETAEQRAGDKPPATTEPEPANNRA